ncbi:MAG: transcriptional regulator with XRE-family HTH domain [Dinoroseobacter sp.]|jgi:transcriptional regulator with XRE-family HTH domain
MPKSGLTGSRIRERRQALSLRQSELARLAGISASYLNLIEHNRRKIGGKVLIQIARALGVEIATLTEGAEEALLEALREAASMSRKDTAELDRLEEFVSRFPGWARLIAAQRRRTLTQDRTIEALNDRLTHDPFLAEALHDLLSNVTAIQSTAGILIETPEIEVQWRDRFTRNIHEESSRLAEGSQALVSYFEDQVQAAETRFTTPLEALDVYLAAKGYHLPELEGADGSEQIDALVEAAPELITPQSRALARSYFEIYVGLAGRLPAEAVTAFWAETPDPAALASAFGVQLSQAMQRLATLPADAVGQEFGLIVSDGAGALLFRKALDGFPVPRYGAACAIWPLYQALTHPLRAQRHTVETPPGRRFETWTVAEPVTGLQFDRAPILRASMLVALDRGGANSEAAIPIGTTCRICPRAGCAARREPSVLIE